MSEPIQPSENGSPFHAAELEIQERLGVRMKLDAGARYSIRHYMPDQHRTFFAQLPFICIGATDARGQPWASVLVGHPGFLSSPDPKTLRINARLLPCDPLHSALANGSRIGLLGIELATRRRNRMNGEISQWDSDGFTVQVGQSFGNCPQYIQRRDFRFVGDPAKPGPLPEATTFSCLRHEDRELISAADTFFIASANPRDDGAGAAAAARGADVSHRGGRPGFVRIDDDATLTVPDFLGNFFFNTIGNLQVEPRAGLLFIDFDNGDMLHIACEAEIIWDGDEVRTYAGAERLMRFRISTVTRAPGALPLRWSRPEYSPLLENTGTWEQVALAQAAEQQRDQWRPFSVQQVIEESATIRSLVLVPADGAGVTPHSPGQFIPIRVPAGAAGQFEQRTYTLSDAANGKSFRISVKRQGRASAWLHDRAGEGALIEVLAPRGGFVFDTRRKRPAVLISAGVGITPMIAMLNTIFANDTRVRFPQQVLLIHGARNGREHAFGDFLRERASRHASLHLHVAYSQPLETDELGRTHQSVGRINIDLLKRLLVIEDYEFYLCGPPSFMQSLYDGLRASHVPDHRIRFESFGVAGVVRKSPQPTPRSLQHQERVDDLRPTMVTFAKSGTTVQWQDPEQSLLELAESSGLTPLYGCRIGSCGSCTTRVISGQVAQRAYAEAECEAGHVLICIAGPGDGDGSLTLDL